ncbi:hypothetical protein Golax_014700 [Gossypium laxum]|uniref:Uncharacterized protein n=3 Tax=Gossypium TaxID=3633 RepID=A0A7J8RY84_GOSDV|nr:hypothetical protein [Gossypium davidsonii]MBA0653642.1 hypothetical protein [Gossypium klotzschianum]MBA0715819.1 hypothetical protein [Gossypium laxum]
MLYVLKFFKLDLQRLAMLLKFK